jgi:outer membrane protein assembly factor BamB
MKKVAQVIVTTVLASFTFGANFGYAADWPQWRGPSRDGISTETGLIDRIPAEGPKLVWKSTGLGAGFSTVSVADGRIYTCGDRADSSFVFALNAKDGKQVWAARLGKPGAPGWGGFAGPRATPTVSGDLLFTVDQWGELVCLSTADGTEKWRKHFEQDFGGKRPEWGFSESPLVDGEKLLVTPGGAKGAIVALDKKSGALLWQTSEFTDPAHYSSLIIAQIGGVKQYIQLTEESVVGVSTEGKLLWKATRKGKTAVIPTPVVKDNFVYVSSGYGTGCNLFKVSSADGKFSVEQVYDNKVIANHHGGVILIGDFVYGHSDNKGWTCQDLKTGEAKWQDKSMGKGAVVCADGKLFLRQEDKQGTVAMIAADPSGYKELGRFDQPDRSGKQTWPHPVISDGKLYLRDQDVLLCYDLKK